MVIGERRGRGSDRGVRKQRANICLKSCLHLAQKECNERDLLREGGKTPGGADPLGGLSRGNSRPDARFN